MRSVSRTTRLFHLWNYSQKWCFLWIKKNDATGPQHSPGYLISNSKFIQIQCPQFWYIECKYIDLIWKVSMFWSVVQNSTYYMITYYYFSELWTLPWFCIDWRSTDQTRCSVCTAEGSVLRKEAEDQPWWRHKSTTQNVSHTSAGRMESTSHLPDRNFLWLEELSTWLYQYCL